MKQKLLFLFGLFLFLIGQLFLAKGNEYVYNQEPIDFAHWFLLVGAVCLIPQVVNFKKKIFSYVGIPLTFIGIIAIVGMCVIDFIFWSYPTQELRNEFAIHLSKEAAIWKPFMSIGPSSKVFNLGLLILSLNYLNDKKIGIGIILLANLILWHLIPVPYRLVFGYSLTLIGFTYLWYPFKKLT